MHVRAPCAIAGLLEVCPPGVQRAAWIIMDSVGAWEEMVPASAPPHASLSDGYDAPHWTHPPALEVSSKFWWLHQPVRRVITVLRVGGLLNETVVNGPGRPQCPLALVTHHVHSTRNTSLTGLRNTSGAALVRLVRGSY